MRITVFGATGRTGRHLLAEELRRGHRPYGLVAEQPHLIAPVVRRWLAAAMLCTERQSLCPGS